MNRMLLILALSVAMISGCAGNRALMQSMSSSTASHVFQEVDEKAPPVPGLVDLRIYASLKTHQAGLYSKTDLHGTPGYTLLLNIDGQAVELSGAPQREQGGDRHFTDPEAGDGVRYLFTKRLRLKPGVHRIFVGIPADGLSSVIEAAHIEEDMNSLTVEPLYGAIKGKKRPEFHITTSFKEGLKSIRLVLNGQAL